MKRIYHSKHNSTLPTVGSSSTGYPRWCLSTLSHRFSSLIINLPLTQLFRCATLLQKVSSWLNYFAECLHKALLLMLLLLTNTSLTALSSCFCSSREISLSRMEQLINQLLDPQLFCPPFSNFRRIVSRLFTKPSNSSTNNWRQNTPTDRHYNSLSFNCKMILPYCATCSSPTGLSPLKTPLTVLYSTLTLLQLHNCFLALRNLLFVVLPRWALRDHPERKQKILQTSISSPHPTRRKSSNYGAKLHIKNLQTRKSICKWNSNLYTYHCGHSLSIVFLIW